MINYELVINLIERMDSVHNPDKFKDKAVRTKPSQARGKERVRLILASALALFQEHGIEKITTNDIAEKAKIPIGSLYRYYPNKDSITTAIIDLYAEDISATFRDIASNPTLQYMSWEEVMTILLDSWANYSRLNGSFSFLFAIWSNPRLSKLTQKSQDKFMIAFTKVLKKRCPKIKMRQALICFNLSIVAVKMSINKQDEKIGGDDLLQEAAEAIALYMTSVCDPQNPESGDILV